MAAPFERKHRQAKRKLSGGFDPAVRLDPSRVRDLRDQTPIQYWIAQWWNGGGASLQGATAKARARATGVSQQFGGPQRISLPIARATPQPRRR